jgi:hypothetical protein
VSLALDVAIGLAFLYLLLALIVMTTQELIATFTNWRAKDLYSAIESMLEGNVKGQSPLVQAVFKHPLIKNLRQDPSGEKVSGGPSYIPSRTFAAALLDVLQREQKASDAAKVSDVLEGAQQLVDQIAVPQVREPLQALVKTSRLKADQLDTDVAVVTVAIESWFNDRMARASGWYKRKSQIVGLILSGVLVTLANADSIEIGGTLWRDAALREAVVAEAKAYHEANARKHEAAEPNGDEGSLPERAANDPIKRLEASAVPLGWHAWPAGALGYVLKLVGLVMSGLAVSLGGGFWFNALSRFLQLRGTGPRVSPKTGNSEGAGA